MKKRRLLVTLALSTCLLTACGRKIESNPTANAVANEMSNFKTIDGKDYLSYNLDTRIVYYMFCITESSGYGEYGLSYFAPYLSENGKFCRYINDEIVEITDTNK